MIDSSKLGLVNGMKPGKTLKAKKYGSEEPTLPTLGA
jgi:hypothetical protein